MVWSGGDAGGGVRVFCLEAEAGLGAVDPALFRDAVALGDDLLESLVADAALPRLIDDFAEIFEREFRTRPVVMVATIGWFVVGVFHVDTIIGCSGLLGHYLYLQTLGFREHRHPVFKRG